MARVRRRKADAPEVPELPADEGNIPGVLTVEAVKRGAMPALGTSGLPPSLEADVPEPFRYWKATDDARAREVRDSLVEAGIFEPASIMKINGEPRRVITKYFLAEETDVGRELATLPAPELVASRALADTEDPPILIDRDPALTDDGNVSERIATWKANLGTAHKWCATFLDTVETRKALLASELSAVFKIATRPGLIFGSTVALDVPPNAHIATLIERIDPEPVIDKAEELAKSAISRARLVKADSSEERFVLGVVLEPDVIDSQDDTYDEVEVRKAAHFFMADFAQIGHQHSAIVTGKIKILESYLAPVDFEAGGETIKKGTWLLAVRVVDDALWESIKAGDLTGFSIGGVAMRAPAETPPT